MQLRNAGLLKVLLLELYSWREHSMPGWLSSSLLEELSELAPPRANENDRVRLQQQLATKSGACNDIRGSECRQALAGLIVN